MNAQTISKNKGQIKAGITSSTLLLLLTLQGCGGSSQDASSSNNISEKVCQPASDTADLFMEVEPETQDDLGELDRGIHTIRRRGVTVNTNSFKKAIRGGPGSTLRLGLFADKTLEVLVDKVQTVSSENVIVVGRIKGQESSSATLVMNKGVLVANLSEQPGSGGHFEIRHGKDGVHSIEEMSVDQGEDPESCLAFELPGAQAAASNSDLSTVQADPVVDMLVAYTPNARDKQGGTDGIQALIQMGIADTNQAMIDSGVALSVRLVGTMEVSENESDFSADLSALKSTSDGRWDEVHAERKRLGADQVTLVGSYASSSGTAGIGYINASASSAFTIVRTSAFGQYTFSHELGHNLGLRHEDGFVDDVAKFRTIMAYGSYTRIRHYSNPALYYKGSVTGDATHNSAQIINANALRMSSLVAMVVTPDPTPTPTPTPSGTPDPVPQPTPVATATPAPTPSGTPDPEPDPCLL